MIVGIKGSVLMGTVNAWMAICLEIAVLEPNRFRWIESRSWNLQVL